MRCMRVGPFCFVGVGGCGGGTRCRCGQGRAKAIIFSMLSEFLNACVIFFVPAIVITCAVDHEEAGALIALAVLVVVARVVIWVKDRIQKNTGGKT